MIFIPAAALTIWRCGFPFFEARDLNTPTAGFDYQDLRHVKNYSDPHRENHRRVYPWLAGPLFARHMSLVPSDRLISLRDSETTISSFEMLLRAHDPAFLLDPDGKQLDAGKNRQMYREIKEKDDHIGWDRWSFGPASDGRKKSVRAGGSTRSDPPNVVLSRPYLSHAVPYLFENGEAKLVETKYDESAKNLCKANVRLLLRGDIFGEYMTITQMIELPLNSGFFENFGDIDPDNGTPKPLEPSLIEQLRVLMGLEGEALNISPAEAKEAEAKVREFAYKTIWKKIDDENKYLRNKFVEKRSDHPLAIALSNRDAKTNFETQPGPLLQRFDYFGDFRIVCPQVAEVNIPECSAREYKYYESAVLKDARAFSAVASSTAKDDKAFSDASVNRRLRFYWPLWSDTEHASGTKEIAACTFLNQSVLYVSSLGFEAVKHDEVENGSDTHGDDTKKDDRREPLTCLLVSGLNDPWQLSRMVFRVLMLGTTRLIAIRQIGKFYTASDQINKLEYDVRKEIKRRLWIGAFRLVPFWHYWRFRKLLERFLNIEKFGLDPKEISPISQHKPIDRFVGGLRFRISRSRYYARSYKERIEDLDERKIPGYQSYLEVMRRRLFATFAGIDSLEGRLNNTDMLLQDMLALCQEARNFRLAMLAFFVSFSFIVFELEGSTSINPSCWQLPWGFENPFSGLCPPENPNGG